MMTNASSIAIIVPKIGGGTERHAREMVDSWNKQGMEVVFLEVSGRIIKATIINDSIKSFSFLLIGNEDNLLDLMKQRNVSLIHYHHFIHLSEFLLSLPERLNIPFYVTLHDYFTVCPSINLVNFNGEYCQDAGILECNYCLRKCKKNIHNHIRNWPMDIRDWRSYWEIILYKAKLVFVPQADVYKRMYRYFPNLKMRVFENPEIVLPNNIDDLLENKKKWSDRENRHIGLIGAITPIKGANTIVKCAQYMMLNKLPIKFILFGTLESDICEKIPDNLEIFGRYNEDEVYKKIIENEIDFFWFPCICPETYSYTLSIPIKLHIPVLGADIGAVGNRIISHQWGDVYYYKMPISQLCDRLISFGIQSKDTSKFNFVLENEIFPSYKKLYMIESKLNDYDKKNNYYVGLSDKMESNMNVLKLSHIIGIEYRAIFRQPITKIKKLCTLFLFDYPWLINNIRGLSWRKILWKIKILLLDNK